MHLYFAKLFPKLPLPQLQCITLQKENEKNGPSDRLYGAHCLGIPTVLGCPLS